MASPAPILRAFADALRPPPQITVSEWADTRRVLSQKTSANHGPWKTSKTPYLREIMDHLSPHHPAKQVTFMKSARVGGSEVYQNAIGAWVELAPGPIMVVQPTIGDVEEWSKDVLDEMIELAPALKQRFVSEVRAQRSRKASFGRRLAKSSNTLRHKDFLGGAIFGVGANTPAGFRRRTARYLAKDELDGWPGVVGEEGDPSALADTRTTTYPHSKKIFNVSTPTIKGRSRIEKLYMQSDQRVYEVPCPHCGVPQELRWSGIKWPKGEPEKAYYQCRECEEAIDHRAKAGMLELGEWVAQNDNGTHPGFHISTLYSPWVSWGAMAAEFVAANDDKSQLRVFVNTKLGQTWEEDGEQLDARGLLARRERWWEGDELVVPAGANLLTAGVDTQDDRFEVAVWAWGEGREAWLVDYVVIWGDPADQQTQDDLDAVLDRTYPHETYRDGLRISGTLIDSAGHRTDHVYRYCKARKSQRRYPIIGRDGDRPIWPRDGRVQHRAKAGRVTLFTVGVDAAKNWWQARVQQTEPYRVHFPETPWCDLDFFEEFTVEEKRLHYKRGRPIERWWKPDGARNEAWDCSVYAFAALEMLISQGRDPGQPLQQARRARPAAQESTKQSFLGPRKSRGGGRKGWLR